MLVVAAPGGPNRRRRSAAVGPRGSRSGAQSCRERHELRAAAAAGRAAARLPRGPRQRRLLRGARGRVHPDHRRAGASSARTSSPSTGASWSDGLERGLDATVTRTLMGNAYPTPGLLQQVLRHGPGPALPGGEGHRRAATTASRSPARPSTTRTWATRATSTARTTSTARSSPTRSRARKGWPALNFFFNTAFDCDNLLISDEPWSRPGDYVMLRALTDLVCASSACPDDIDPSNGWEVTDVHVRVYSPENRFSQAIARRVTADSEAELTRETAFHPRTLRAHEELRGVPRLLAASLLQQRGRRGRVLGVPRAGPW